MSAPVFPLRAVAALFIERQHLDRPRTRRLTEKSLARFAEDAGGIQLDSINVVERAHHLTLWNRFGPYDRRALERLVYRRRVLFEYWAHAACLVPTSDLAPWRRAMLDYTARYRGWKFLKKNERLIAEVEGLIREQGPMGNLEFTRRAAVTTGRRRKSSGWWNWQPATHALDYLWMSGRTMVHSRRHFQKRFDIADRVMPALAEVEPLAAEAFVRWHLRRSLRAMGAATTTDLSRYLTYPRMVSERKRALAAAIAEGEIVEIQVQGDRARWLALAEDLPALASAARSRIPSRGSALLAPFDSFLWHRERTSRLFGFDYRIEVYTPGHKRVHGYYTLPIFHAGQLIGRLDPKTHREERRLEVRGVHFERWFAAGKPPPAAAWGAVDRDAGIAGVAEALQSLATFVGADRVSIGRVFPAALTAPLRRALK
ncbi:MAG TPA: crosslink repair DNA glycosylase YcaQ family protein [Candidatus Eisenbacteria bacterium]|nr:crosslink repair DNA glycosylase YcaQ family protein [Candidatus Eisenbacteria bacterium]